SIVTGESRCANPPRRRKRRPYNFCYKFRHKTSRRPRGNAMIAMLGPSSPDRIGKNSRPARASRWLGRVLCGAAVLAAAALAAPPVYAQAAPAVRAVEPAAVREQIESLLGRMAAAVRAADQEAYLACVSLDDPVFATEQRNWAKDLERAAPERFELTLRDDPVVGP